MLYFLMKIELSDAVAALRGLFFNIGLYKTNTMRFTFILLALIVTIMANAQTIKVLDGATQQAIPYATVLFYNQGKIVSGMYAGEDGVAAFKGDNFDAAEFSCIGYKTLMVPKENVKDTVLLTQEPYEMAPLTITKTNNGSGQKSVALGFAKSKKSTVVVAKQGAEVAIYIKNSNGKPQTIKSFVFKAEIRENYRTAFRVHFYKKDAYKAGPGEEIAHGDIIKYLNRKSKKAIEVDVLGYQIELPAEGIYAGIEWLSSTNPEGVVLGPDDSNWYNTLIEYNTADASVTYYRYRLNDLKWGVVAKGYNASFGITVLED